MHPSDNVGLITSALEKYHDVKTGQMKAKARPVLIIGFERHFSSTVNVDYEVIPFSRIGNFTPDPDYDVHIDTQRCALYSLHNECYLRTHKTSWIHSKNLKINTPFCNLKIMDNEMFESAVELNHTWVYARTALSVNRFAN